MDGLQLGRIVHYVLTQDDADAINRRRIEPSRINYGSGVGQWPIGAQAHVGAYVYPGDHIPSMIVHIWSPDGTVNLKCFLNGNDDYWVQGALFAPSAGQAVPDSVELIGRWHWLEKA